jgi:hypothetical protein
MLAGHYFLMWLLVVLVVRDFTVSLLDPSEASEAGLFLDGYRAYESYERLKQYTQSSIHSGRVHWVDLVK